MFLKPISASPAGKSHTINSSYQIRFFRIVENLYVNGEYRDDSAIGKLMHDFNCADADDMHYGLLAERTRYLKENSKGVNEMYRTMEEVPHYFFASDTVWKLSISGIRAREEPFSHRI